jgi:hypothetical protein
MIYTLTDEDYNRLKFFKKESKLKIAVEINGDLKGELNYNYEELTDLIDTLNIIKNKIKKEYDFD